jgi:hypothetical protein
MNKDYDCLNDYDDDPDSYSHFRNMLSEMREPTRFYPPWNNPNRYEREVMITAARLGHSMVVFAKCDGMNGECLRETSRKQTHSEVMTANRDWAYLEDNSTLCPDHKSAAERAKEYAK